MIILILFLIIIGLAILERIIYVKRKNLAKVRLFIGILITCLLLLISYLITDTALGVFYVFLSFISFFALSIVNYRSNLKWLKLLSYMTGLPFIVYILIRAIQNMLVYPRYIMFLILTVNIILGYSYTQKWTKKEYIFFGIGIVLAATILFSYYKFFGYGNRVMMKQELVAQEFLEEELGLDGFEVYIRVSDGNLRGKEAAVRAYDESGTFILMTYKNNEIISYEIKEGDINEI